MKMFFASALSTGLLVLSDSGWACAVCGSQEEKASGAYLAMTIFLSLLPLSLIGGVGYWVWRRAKAIERKENPQHSEMSPWQSLILDGSSPEDPIAVQD